MTSNDISIILSKGKLYMNENRFEAYSEEMLIDCQNGKCCSYGICDECPNTLRNQNDME